MISPESAARHVRRHARRLPGEVVPIGEALGRVIDEDVRTRVPFPAFDNSAMDGYALRASSTAHATPVRPARLSLLGAVFAGDTSRRALGALTACPIMTGAPLPRGADTIIPVETARVENGELVVTDPVPSGRHVRRGGDEARKGARVLERGVFVNPGAVAVLAAAGRSSVRVTRMPRVSLIATGDETVPAGRRLAHGQIHDSNSPMVAAMLRELGVRRPRVRAVGDNRGALARSIGAALASSDVVIVTGGVSVGERDHIKDVFEAARVRRVFWRVSQKPGKPLYFGVRGRKLVFGLPGNPASVFTCFHLYVAPAIRRMSGRNEGARLEERVLAVRVPRDGLRWRFLKAKTAGTGGVVPLPHQASHMVTSLAHASHLLVVPPGRGAVEEGTTVQTYRISRTGEST